MFLLVKTREQAESISQLNGWDDCMIKGMLVTENLKTLYSDRLFGLKVVVPW